METEKPVTQEQPSRRWLLLPFKWVFNLLIGFALLCYAVLGVTAMKDLYKRNLYQSQDFGALYADIDAAAQSGDSTVVARWLNSRPLSETDKMIGIITPKSAGLATDVFFEISRRELKRGRTEEAFFWLQLGRYRLIYDIIRCGAEPDAIKRFDPVFEGMRSPATDELLRKHPEILKKTAQRILDFDAKYPAHNNPGPLCKTILPVYRLPADEINWESFHRALREHTEEFLKSTDPAAPKALPEKKSLKK